MGQSKVKVVFPLASDTLLLSPDVNFGLTVPIGSEQEKMFMEDEVEGYPYLLNGIITYIMEQEMLVLDKGE